MPRAVFSLRLEDSKLMSIREDTSANEVGCN